MPIAKNEISDKANGGTELAARRLEGWVDPGLMDKVQISCSRVRELDPTRHRVLWCQDLPGDPESEHLKNGGWRRFHVIVFVSHWQMLGYIAHYGIPWSRCVVLPNAVEPMLTQEDVENEVPCKFGPDDGPVRIIYHTTPHRGLEILAPVFRNLRQRLGEQVELDVYSSFKLYGWEGDERYAPVFDMLDQTDGAYVHGAVPNDEVRLAVKSCHVFAYPSIWLETSCMCLMEAMLAGLRCVHPNYGALYETASAFTDMYQWRDSKEDHAQLFESALGGVVDQLIANGHDRVRSPGRAYAEFAFSTKIRAIQWTNLLTAVVSSGMPVGIPQAGQALSFSTGGPLQVG